MRITSQVKGGEKTEHELGDLPLTVVCHQQGIKVDAPDCVEIGARQTIPCVEALNQSQWDWLSTGPIFKDLFGIAFKDQDIEIPASVDDLKHGDLGIVHISGMIILAVEACMAGKNIFLREPEMHLHPKTQASVMSMINRLMELMGGGAKQTATASPEPEDTSFDDTALTIRWLKAHDPAKAFAKIGDTTFTVADMLLEVAGETEVGKAMVQKFCEMRDGA
jgi:hypothetical protein